MKLEKIAINAIQSIDAAFVLTEDNLARDLCSNIESGQFGRGMLHHGGAAAAQCRMAWRLEREGTFDLWVEYACAEQRPMRLLLDGAVISQAMVPEVTGGWLPAQAMWRFQRRVRIPRAGTLLTLERSGPSPHVKKVALVAIDPASPLAMNPVDAGPAVSRPDMPGIAERLEARRPEPMELVRALAPALRGALSRGVTDQEIATLVAGLCGAIRRDRAEPQARVGFFGPLNGQRIRQGIFNELCDLFAVDALLETGAYLGTTTEFFALSGLPVYSCEAQAEYFHFAAARLAELHNVELFHADSRKFLQRYFAQFAARHSFPLFYLDAHWQDDLPLPEEIDLIADNQASFAVMIDDFKSPFDRDYGHDAYSSGAELTLEYIRPRLRTRRQLAFAFPSVGAAAETGARRGTLVLCPAEIYGQHLAANRNLTRAA